MSKLLGIGWVLGFDSTPSGTPTYGPIGQILDFEGPGATCASVDVSGMDANKSYLPGQVDYGKFTFKLGYDSASANSTDLSALLGARTIAGWQVKDPSGTQAFTFLGFLTSFKPNFPRGEYVTADIEIQLTSSAF